FAVALTATVVDEAAIGRATAEFLEIALAADAAWTPPWLDAAGEWIGEGSSTCDIARWLDLHPAYLARAYRHSTGEGMAETQRRRRVEEATALLRRTPLPLAEVALAAGFCDQGHMNRCFSAVLGRTPLRVRQERPMFDRSAAV